MLVIGSGAAGFATAITARKLGLDVLMLEKAPWFGGTTAVSGGWLWIPCNAHAKRARVEDSLDAARLYLQGELGARYESERVDAYLEGGPAMVDFFERETAVRFMLGSPYPDYHPTRPGGLPSGRAICAQPYDGRELGARLADLRPPVPEMTLFGLKVGSGPDFQHFSRAGRSLRSTLYVAGRVLRHGADVARFGRDVLLMSGNALVARLAKSAFDLQVPLWLSAPAVELVQEQGRVTGAVVKRGDRLVRIAARRGVVCAAGGFSHDLPRRASVFPHRPGEGEHFSLAAPGNTGDGLRLAERAGGALDRDISNPAAWMPVSRVPYADGRFGVYPHSFERGKPGVIAVSAAGRRFANESAPYHDFVRAMIEARAPGRPATAFLVCDERFIRRYGLGMAKPFPVPKGSLLRSGYLVRGKTIEALAQQLGLEARALGDSLARFNTHAAEGRDPEFHRGEDAYNRYLGDPAHAPNPCLAPIDRPPYYAVRIVPGDLGTFMGLRTDRHAAVLDGERAPIPGLFAVGADMGSLFAGSYPGPGINLGPAMTFGYLCAQHLARSP